MGSSLSIGLADGLLPSPPGVDLQHSLKRKGREDHVSVSNAVDCCVFNFPPLPPFFLSSIAVAPRDMNRHVADLRCGLRTTKKWPLRPSKL